MFLDRSGCTKCDFSHLLHFPQKSYKTWSWGVHLPYPSDIAEGTRSKWHSVQIAGVTNSVFIFLHLWCKCFTLILCRPIRKLLHSCNGFLYSADYINLIFLMVSQISSTIKRKLLVNLWKPKKLHLRRSALPKTFKLYWFWSNRWKHLHLCKSKK